MRPRGAVFEQDTAADQAIGVQAAAADCQGLVT
jgi:hypothetical protein